MRILVDMNQILDDERKRHIRTDFAVLVLDVINRSTKDYLVSFPEEHSDAEKYAEEFYENMRGVLEKESDRIHLLLEAVLNTLELRDELVADIQYGLRLMFASLRGKV